MGDVDDTFIDVLNTRTVFLSRNLSEKIMVGGTCCLTVVGSVCVIVSYVCFRSLRSQARQILVNLSLADFAIGMVNLVGVVVDFDRFYYNLTAHGYAPIHPSALVDSACKAQAFVGSAAALSSVTWTVCLAIYMYLLVLQNQQRTTAYKYYLLSSYVVCYCVPFLLSVWLLLTGRLGNAPYNASGWCGIIAVKRFGSTFAVDYFAIIFGFDLWVYLAFALCATAYTALFLQLNVHFPAAIELVGFKKYWKSALEFLDYRLVLIPIAFILLRMWTCIINLLFVYIGIDPTHLSPYISKALIYLAGIGDSGQGFVNGLLFVLFTGEVRARFLSCKIKSLCFKTRRRCLPKISMDMGEEAPLIPSRSKQGLTNEWGYSITPPDSFDAECST